MEVWRSRSCASLVRGKPTNISSCTLHKPFNDLVRSTLVKFHVTASTALATVLFCSSAMGLRLRLFLYSSSEHVLLAIGPRRPQSLQYLSDTLSLPNVALRKLATAVICGLIHSGHHINTDVVGSCVSFDSPFYISHTRKGSFTHDPAGEVEEHEHKTMNTIGLHNETMRVQTHEA